MILKLFRKLKKILNKLFIGKKVNHQLPQINVMENIMTIISGLNLKQIKKQKSICVQKK